MNTQQVTTRELDSERTAPAVFLPPRLPFHPEIENRFGISRAHWKVLTDAIFPTAQDPSSIILALSYCQARKLDVMKKPVHIVPMKQKRTKANGKTEWVDVDTIWPSIAELRTTAMRTGEYAGKDPTAFGPTIERTFSGTVREWEDGPNGSRQQNNKPKEITVAFPEWAEVTVYRMVRGVRCAFVGPKVFWLEQYATLGRWSDLPNEMWETRPFGQPDKCAEAAALRCAFPEEIGNQYAAEEMEGRRMLAETAEAARDVSPPRSGAISGPPRRVITHTQQPADNPPDDGGENGGEEVTKVVTPSGPPRKVPDKEAPKPKEEPKPQPQASGAMPDAKDKQAFLKWIDAKLKECPDADAVMLAWTDEIYENIPADLHDGANELLQNRLADVGGEP